MKNIAFTLGLFLMLISCGNENQQKNQDSWQQNSQNASNRINTYLENKSSSTNNVKRIPSGYTHYAFKEYVPINTIEKQLMKDIKALDIATQNLDYKSIANLTYPDYYKFIQKQIPDKSISEIKTQYEKILAKGLDDRLRKRAKDWPDTKHVSLIVTNILNRVKEGNGLLYLYEYHEVLLSETDTIYKNENEYSIVISLNNGKKWYTGANSIQENFEILGLRFSNESIEELFTKK